MKGAADYIGAHEYGIYDVICRNAQRYPDRVCVVFKDLRITYREFKRKCDQTAFGLFEEGVRDGDRICVFADNCPEIVISYGACAKIGAIVAPINCRLKKEEVKHIFEDCLPRVLIVGSAYLQQAMEASRGVKSVERIYSIGCDQETRNVIPFERLYEARPIGPVNRVSGQSGFVIISTAAVGGHAKGALHTQKGILALTLQMMAEFSFGPDDCHICHVPLYHMAAIAVCFSVMHVGGKNVLTEGFQARETLRLTEEENGTFWLSYAPMLKTILEEECHGSHNLASLRNVAGLEQEQTIRRFLNVSPYTTFWVGYGQTEAVWVSSCPFDEMPGSAGRPSLLVRLALLDDQDCEVQVGCQGEICVRSPVVFSGYWGMDEETSYTFRHGWHHTGDIGRFDEKGYLWYVGRKAEKDLIKPGGENVYPGEVERALLAHPSIKEACVFGVDDEEWGESIKAVCVLKGNQRIEADDLAEFVASKIARYKKPKTVVYVKDLPKKGGGEIDREQVKRDHGRRIGAQASSSLMTV